MYPIGMPTPPASGVRVALLLPLLTGGGAERVTLNLIEGLQALGCEVHLVVFAVKGELVGAVPPDVKLVDLGSGRALTSPLPLARYLKRERPDVLVGVEGHANLPALLARRLAGVSTRLVLTEHIALTETPSGIKDRAYRALARMFYPHAEATVAVSEGVAASFAAGTGLPTESVNVIYNPVLTEQYWRAIERTPEHPWFAPGELPVIMGVGRLVAQKDFPNLIRAFAEVRSRVDARLMILGEGPDRAKLEQLVTELELGEWVSLPGFVKDPVSLMARAATFALSSVREGLPTVLIEALATGVPVVSTDCESGPREILRGGELGRLVPVGDSAALAEAITAALSEPARKVDPVHLQEYFPKESARKYLQAAGIDA